MRSGADEDGGAGVVAGLGQCSWDFLYFIDEYPPPDTKREVSGLVEQGGGPVATALVALARLGIVCRFAGVVADDAYGENIRRSLVEEGVDAGGLVVRGGGKSQVAFIAVERETARRTIFWQRPAAQPLRPSEVSEGFLDNVSLLMLDGLMPDVSIDLASRAREQGIPVVLDAGRIRPGMMELAALCDHVVGSEEFGMGLGMDMAEPEGFYDRARQMLPGLLSITLGARGCVCFAPEGVMRVPAFEVDAVDTTGAGDVFHAGYAYGVLKGVDHMERLRFASAAAALGCRALGGRASLPTVKEVRALL